MIPYVLIWGGGDLASGVVLRLHRVGIRVVVVENAQPMAVRLSVSFAQAVFDGETQVEDVTGRLIHSPDEMEALWNQGSVPVMVDPDLALMESHRPLVLVDARMRKKFTPIPLESVDLLIGLGPGFIAGENCHAAIETNRGHFLGRVYWAGSTEADTGVPGVVQSYGSERVLYSPATGVVSAKAAIGDIVEEGDAILSVDGRVVHSPFSGIIRGLIHDGMTVQEGTKVGDVDPRPEAFRCKTVSEKSLAIGGSVLEAVLTRKSIRAQLWEW